MEPVAQTTQPIAPEAPKQPAKYQWVWAPAVFGLLTFAMFADVLFTSQRVISHVSTDLQSQFLNWREYGFGQLAQGNLPLWNPHVYGGQAYFAGFQSALLYPPNWLHLILPVPVAINWIVAIHVFALGYFVYFWCRGRGIGIGGSILAGVMIMFCGPYFLHVYAGHLPHLAIIVWTPLMLMTLDRLAATGSMRWALFGIFVASMHILAGHPQYVYYTGIILSFYTALLLVRSPKRLQLAGGFVMMYVGAVLVTAVQLFAGIQAAGESVRGGGTDFNFAATFSLPPDHLLTFFVPTFFQNVLMDPAGKQMPYWGIGYLWEMTLFISISGLMLAVWGIFHFEPVKKRIALASDAEKSVRPPLPINRQAIIPLIIIAITLTLALGRYTWFYRPLFDYLPGYSSFRGTVKFAYLCVMFIALLAGMGFDSLIRQRRVSHWYPACIAALGLFAFIMAASIGVSSGKGTRGSWSRFVTSVVESSIIDRQKGVTDIYNGAIFNLRKDPAYLSAIGEYSAQYTAVAGATLLAVAGLIWASRFHRLAPYGLIALASVEMFCFAYATRATMDPAIARSMPSVWQEALDKHDKNQRIVILDYEAWARGMSLGFDNLSGNDPNILRRYAELVYVSVGASPADAKQYLPFMSNQPLNGRVLSLLRCDLVFGVEGGMLKALQIPNPMPVALLYSKWMKVSPNDALRLTVNSGNIDLTRNVLVEGESQVPMMPSDESPGTLRLVSQTTDSLEFEVDLRSNAMLLVTNNYSTGWRVLPIESQQARFDILPANYTHMGIPLRAGKHHFVLDYSPLAFRVGRWVSILSILALSTWSILLMRRSGKFR